MEKQAKIYVAGHKGLVGSAIVRRLEQEGYKNFLFRSSKEVDLTNQVETQKLFETEKPDYVFVAAAKVGGILANNSYPAQFIYENLIMESNIIHAAYQNEVKKLLFLGSSCIYPKMALQPLNEEYLLTGPLEPTNEWYAIAKIAGIKLCQAYRRQYGCNFISVMPTNLYGPNDNFDMETSHVLPALIRKFHEAKHKGDTSVSVWGSGTPRREFLFVDDLADACCFVMDQYEGEQIVNIGTGTDITIADLAAIIAEITGFVGKIVYDASKPDGTPVKRLDVTKLSNLGWKATTSLRDGLAETYQWYVSQTK
ncbi:GDP-L-fucose synthase [Acetonema longum]|uniref:GDP-L-fucose synthase n=1 Tax=Acetonema longum DSM 6540 TaxID=1009370 RepID=F7NNR4_9FIRM|nr:GDP-L-fucose synthase [Acetonema longum]EGO62248.1 GDP-fucose synthetase [Acetonema longum DSM 6540]